MTQTTARKAAGWLGEVSGAVADFGTFLPLVIGVLAVRGFDGTGVLTGFGLFALAVALVYRRPIPIQPMKAVAALTYRHPMGFHDGPNIEWVPQAYFVDNANTVATKSYVLFGFRAGYEVSKDVSMFVDLRNLANTKYIASSSVAATATDSSSLFEPGTGRSVFVGLRAAW